MVLYLLGFLLIFAFINPKNNENSYFKVFQNNYFSESLNCLSQNNINLNSGENEDIPRLISQSCKHSSKNFKNFFKNNKICKNCKIPKSSKRAAKYINDLFKDLLNKYDINNNKSSIELGKALKFNKKITNKYILKYPKYIILFIFWILIFILFFVFLVCFIFKYFCFVPRNIENKQIWILIIISVLCLGIFVLSIIAYIENNYVNKGFNNMVCSTSKIKGHLLNGDEYQKGASWIGVEEINSIIFDSLDEIFNYKKVSKEQELDIRNNSEKIIQIARYLITIDYEKEIENPNPKGGTIPSIIFKYNNKEDLNSFTWQKYYTLDSFKDMPLNIADYIGKEIIFFESEENNLIGLADDNSEFFNDLVKFYDSINITLNEEYYNTINNIVKGFTISRIILFYLTLILSIFGVIIFILLIYKNIKTFLNFAWILFYIFMLLTLVISFLFGFLGSYSKDLVSGLNSYIKKNITINKNEDNFHNISNITIDKCLKGNGDFNLDKNGIFKFINRYYNLSRIVNQTIKNYDYYYNNVIDVFNNISNFYTNEVSYLIRTETPELNESLKELRLYVDASANGSLIQNYSNIYDAIVISKEDCPNGYSYLNVSERLKLDGNKYCLIIDEWINEQDIRDRYEKISTEYEATYIDIVLSYFISYRKFINNYDNLIFKEIKFGNEILSLFQEYERKTKLSLYNISHYLSNLSLIFDGKLKKDESIFDLINCIFIQRDLNKGFHEAYFSFSKKLTLVSILHLIIGILEGILFIIYYLLFAYEVRDNEEVKELTKKNNEILGPLTPKKV